jgi:hypothetical protein
MWMAASRVSVVLGRSTVQDAMKSQASTGLRPACRRRPLAVGESRDWKVESARRNRHSAALARRVARRAGAERQPRARWTWRTRSERWRVDAGVARIGGAQVFHRSGRDEVASEHGASPRVPPPAFGRRRE